MANKMLYPINSLKRQVIDLSGIWSFQMDFDSNGLTKGFNKALDNPIDMPVPASYNDFFTEKEFKEFTGDVWYEKTFYADESWKNKDVDIRFFGAIHKAKVYFNGKEIASHNGGFLPFSVNINEFIDYNIENKITVLLNNELDHTTLPCGESITLKNGRKLTTPYFDFFNYGGLIRPVKLVITPKKSIIDITLNHEIVGPNTITKYQVETVLSNDLVVKVYDQNYVLVSEAKGVEGNININNTHLWQPLNSYLYKFVFSLYDNNVLVDEYSLDVGIRTVSIVGNRVLINNSPVYFKGFGKHEDADFSGRGYNLNVIKRDFELMKWIGANSFRTSHYPYSEEIYQLADKYGIMITDELPAVGMLISTRNAVDAANGAKVVPYFEEDIVHEVTLKNHLNQLEEMITRDKNHASVVIWSLLNEPDTVGSERCVPYFEALFNKAWELDVQKRPRSFANIISSSPDRCLCSHMCDLIMLNRYYGWYIYGGYQIDDGMEALDEELDKWEKLGKPVMFTEYGCDTYIGLTKLPTVQWTENYQVEYLEKNHAIFDKHDCIMGEQVWNFADFQTTEGIIRCDGNKKGIFTRSRQPKQAAFYFRQRWTNLPLDYKSQNK